jgi:carbon storage regulator CsrA
MLVLEREEGERIFIGDHVVLTVVQIKTHGRVNVRLGFEADVGVVIDREELRVKKNADRRNAVAGVPTTGAVPTDAPVDVPTGATTDAPADADIPPGLAATARRVWDAFAWCRCPSDVALVIRERVRGLGPIDALEVLVGLDGLAGDEGEERRS